MRSSRYYSQLRGCPLALIFAVLPLLALPVLGQVRISFPPARLNLDSENTGYTPTYCNVNYADATDPTALVAGSDVILSWRFDYIPHSTGFRVSLLRPLVVNGSIWNGKGGLAGLNFEVHHLTVDSTGKIVSEEPSTQEATIRIPPSYPACDKCILQAASPAEKDGEARSCLNVRIVPSGDLGDAPQGPLLPAGRPDARVLIATGPTSSTTCTPSTLTGLDCQKSLMSNNRYILHWRASGVDLSFAVDAATTGYVAFGFPKRSGKMTGSEAVIGWVSADGTDASVAAYSLLSTDAADIQVNENIQLADWSVSQTNGRTLMRFRYTEATLASRRRRHLLQDAVTVSMTGINNIVFAYGGNNIDRPEDHHANKGSAKINFFDAGNVTDDGGEVEDGGDGRAYYTAHGALMVVGWGVLIPVGVAIARFGKRRDPLWFHAHRGVQTLGLVAATIAFILAMVKFDVDLLDNKHGKVGFAAMICMWAQPVFGNKLLRPHKGDKMRRAWEFLHIGAGRGGVILAIVAIFFGFARYESIFGTEKKARDCWIAWVAFASAMYVVLEWFAQGAAARNGGGGGDGQHVVEMQNSKWGNTRHVPVSDGR